MTMLAVVRVRAGVRMSESQERTLRMLHLPVPNSCSLLKNAPEVMGMLKAVEAYITWGDANDATKAAVKKLAKDTKDEFCRLNPPRKGYGRKGNKVQFNAGGALGPRGEKINALIERMVV